MKRLKAALMGLAGVGAEYLAAIRADDQFDLVAVAETDTKVLRRFTEKLRVDAYEDYRSLVVDTAHAGLDVLFVSLEPFQSIEFVDLAAKRGVSVFHKAPFARNVREAQRLTRRFAENGCSLVVSRFWQFEPAFADLSCLPELVGHVCAATVSVCTTDAPVGWRGDSARAGGGVLLNGAYEAVDLLVHLLGLPESVHALCSMTVAPGAPRRYDTEDVAAVSLKFPGERIGSLTAVRGAARPDWQVTLIGERATVDLSKYQMTVTPRDPLKRDQTRRYPVQTRHPSAPAISAFGASRLSDGGKAASTADEHLPVVAVIEAAYLSARTAEPEPPGRFLT